MRYGVLGFAAIGCAAVLSAGARPATAIPPSVAADVCRETPVYFQGMYYRVVKLRSLHVRVGGRVDVGEYIFCSLRAPLSLPVRRLPGIDPAVAVRDADFRHVVYVADGVCPGIRAERRLVRCLRRAPLPGTLAPPPAFGLVSEGYLQLAYSSYCWLVPRGRGGRGTCADYVVPTARADIPSVPVERGSTITFRLGFEPSAVSLLLFRNDNDFDSIELEPGVVTTWAVPQNIALPRAFILNAIRKGNTTGQASYAGRFVELAPPTVVPTPAP